MDDIFGVFTAWEELIKARQPKGLDKWESLSGVSHKLSNKKKSDITYTCCHPSHSGAIHVLGSVLGNLHFLLGYVNPGFYLAEYHWSVVDPTIEGDLANRPHPARADLWENSGLELKEEGDLLEGTPHPTVAEDIEVIKKKQKIAKNSKKIKFGLYTYTFVPFEGVVYSSNGHVYKWEIIRDSFLTAKHPELIEYMAVEEDLLQDHTDKSIPSFIVHESKKHTQFDTTVYPLVKSLFPAPGSVIPVSLSTDEVIYSVITNKSIDFYDRDGVKLSIHLFDKVKDCIDLTKGGDVYSSVVYNFGVKYLGLNKQELAQFTGNPDKPTNDYLIKADPSPGFDSLDGEVNEEFSRKVVYDGNTFKLVVKK